MMVFFVHILACNYFPKQVQIQFPPKCLVLTGFLSALFGRIGCCLQQEEEEEEEEEQVQVDRDQKNRLDPSNG